jgi:uncharacterized protein (DUF1778 family)
MPRPRKTRISRQESREYPALQERPAQDVPVLKLSERASITFAEFLLNPPGPNEKATAAARRYMALFPAND